tara:strand:+ start:86 stop:277 length:192 start_codon:yes stop_codon:yes gene_type:complete
MAQSSAVSQSYRNNNKKQATIEQRFIVDRDITDNAIEGIYLTIQNAIDAASVVYQQKMRENPN